MTKQEFLGYMFCDYRFKQLKDKIKKQPLVEVQKLYELHLLVPKNHKFTELEQLFQERLNNEQTRFS